MRAETGRHNMVARVFITLIGAVLIMFACNEVGLALFGKTAEVTDVYTSRFGSRESNHSAETEYKWSVSWTFSVDGKPYSGTATVRGSYDSVRTGDTVYYYAFAPQFNSMYAKGALRIWTVVEVAVGVLLIVAVNLNTKKKGRFAGKTVQQAEKEMTGYDDSVEEAFHDD